MCFAGCGPRGGGVVFGDLIRMFTGQDPNCRPAQPPPPTTRTPSYGVQGRFQGCTLEELARGGAKGIEPGQLRYLGWRERQWRKTTIVEIPYWPDAITRRSPTRRRVGLDQEPRFLWEKGARPKPYLGWEIWYAREQGYIVVVEGETDPAVLHQHGIPPLGIPGAGNWRAEWIEYLKEIPVVFVWQEPGDAGEKFAQSVAGTVGLVYAIRPPDGTVKDPCELAVSVRSGPDPLFLGVAPPPDLAPWAPAPLVDIQDLERLSSARFRWELGNLMRQAVAVGTPRASQPAPDPDALAKLAWTKGLGGPVRGLSLDQARAQQQYQRT